MGNDEKLLSVILLSYYSENRIPIAYEKVKALLEKEKIPFEFIVMDDGSIDNSYQIALELEEKENNVRAYQLSRNYTSHYSIFAGLSKAYGACAMPIVDDEQQPYQTIVDMYRLWEKGNKVVIPFRSKRNDFFLFNFFANSFYKIMNRFSDVIYPPGGADLFFIDREIINILNERIHKINTTTITEILRLGYSPYYYPYERPVGLNNNKSRWTFAKKIRLASDTFFSSSSAPIHFITRLGFFFSLFSFFVILFYLYAKLWGNESFWGLNIPGWTSIILFVSFFGGLNLMALGVIAQYIWRIYEEVKDRPGYIIKKKSTGKGRD